MVHIDILMCNIIYIGEFMNKAFFLDRDGTINVDSGYVGNPDQVVLLPHAAEAIRRMNQAGYLVIVITNQSGVARGYYKMCDVDKVNSRIEELLAMENAHIDCFYVCPHLKGASVKEYDKDCECRKPKVGLFRQAISDFNLNAALCYACGDKIRDVEHLSEIGIPREHLYVMKDGLDLRSIGLENI